MPTTQFTKHDAEEARMVQVTVGDLRSFFDVLPLEEIIPELADIIDETQADVKINNERRFIMIEVIP